MSLARNGHLEPEVIINFADGYAYSKAKMDDAVRSVFGSNLKGTAPKAIKSGLAPRREDVDFIVHEFETSRAHAEKLLSAHEDDLQKTIRAIVGLKPS